MLGAPVRAIPALDNRLLASLPGAAAAALLQDLEPVHLLPGTCLWQTGSALSHAYFPASGVISLGCTTSSGEATELALVGDEGMAGVGSFMGDARAMHRAVARTFCLAYRMPAKDLRARFLEGGPLQNVLLAYALRLLGHISRSSICNLHHSLEQRLCRTLLESAERLHAATLPMTHDTLAELVGARRQGISEAAVKLRALGLIEDERGSIVLLDRCRLAAHACDCYSAML